MSDLPSAARRRHHGGAGSSGWPARGDITAVEAPALVQQRQEWCRSETSFVPGRRSASSCSFGVSATGPRLAGAIDAEPHEVSTGTPHLVSSTACSDRSSGPFRRRHSHGKCGDDACQRDPVPTRPLQRMRTRRSSVISSGIMVRSGSVSMATISPRSSATCGIFEPCERQPDCEPNDSEFAHHSRFGLNGFSGIRAGSGS